MRYLVLSDIHANQIALDAVIKHSKGQLWEKVILLGDCVGYYTEPDSVLNTLQSLELESCILGNHDALVLSMIDKTDHLSEQRALVSGIAKEHSKLISTESIAFLRSFQPQATSETWQAVHGSLKEPWDYLKSIAEAQKNLELMSSKVCFVGHTHVAVIYACITTEKGEMWRAVSSRASKLVYRIPPKARLFVNPGSVGQPRDGNPNASYAIYDETANLIEIHRVKYDIKKVQNMVIRQGYPQELAERLEHGI